MPGNLLGGSAFSYQAGGCFYVVELKYHLLPLIASAFARYVLPCHISKRGQNQQYNSYMWIVTGSREYYEWVIEKLNMNFAMMSTLVELAH